jgi:Ca-activated chloride channel family protein
MPADFHWLRPEWLLAMPLVALVAWRLARRRLAPGSWQRVIDPALVPHVLSRAAIGGTDYRWWLLFLGGTLAAMALAGPSWNRVEQPVVRSSQAMVIALDLSQSMDAQDLSPSRLTRARLKILDILDARSSGQTALVVYSANAFTVTPLTTDSDTVVALVNSLSTDIMPSRGSYPAAAIDKGRDLLQQAGVRDGEVLLVTDGGASSAAEQAAGELREAGYRLSVLGVGTADGAPIPEPGGGFVTDRAGRIVVPRLESGSLRALAASGGGRYAVLTTDNRDIESLLPGGYGGSSVAGDESRLTGQWREEGPWLLLLLLPLAALSFRRGWILILVLGVLPHSEPAMAFSFQDLWQTRDQQGKQLLENGDAARAAAHFENPAWKAVADYRAGNYADSAQGFSSGDDADSYFNTGNALARLGKLESAIAAYERALEIDPDAEDAAYNRDLVRQLLDRQEDAAEGDQGNQQSSSESGGGADQAESDSQSEQAGEEGSQGDASSESESGESAVRSEEEMSQQDLEAMQEELERAAMEAEQQSGDPTEEAQMSEAQLAAERRAQEQQQAMEQWLRRIPNDPGGLLRRKFRYQYQRQGMDQDGNHLWPDDEMQPW